MKRMLVSLILTTFNSRENFIKTYDSICHQTYPNIEIIVIDGNSKDGTKEEIEKRAEKNPAVHWLSEEDTGIYNAMNKGLHMAKGDIIAFFNDEFLTDTAVEQYVHTIERKKCDGAHSDLVYKSVDGKVIRRWRMGEGRISEGWLPGHPTLYLKKEIYEKYGGYKENYRCAADYEFMVRILKDSQVRLAYIPETLISMFYGGTSSNGFRAYWVSFWEGVRALRENGVRFAVWISARRTIKVVKQFVFN